MARISIKTGTRYLLNKAAFIVREVKQGDCFLVEDQSFGGQKVVSRQELLVAWARKDLVFEVHGPHTSFQPDMPLPTKYTIPDFTLIPEGPLREEAKRREKMVRPTLGMRMTREQITQYVAQFRVKEFDGSTGVQKHPKLGYATSRASFERWRKNYIESGYDIRALMPDTPGCGGKGKPRLDPDIEEIYQELFQFYRNNPAARTRQDVSDDLCERIQNWNREDPDKKVLEEPSWSTTYRRIQAEGLSILHRRPTRLEAKATGMVQPGPQPTRILERVEIDHTFLPFLLVDDEDRLPIGCPTLTTAFDAYSGYPLGIFVGFEPPGYLAVQNCLYHAILPKDDVCELYETKHPWLAYGLPDVLVTDQGREFRGKSLEDACGQLGIIHEQLPARTPWYKGKIERFQKTIQDNLMPLPGNTSEFALNFKGHERAVAKDACISLSAFTKLLHIFLLDLYTQRWHKGIQDIPAIRWQNSIRAGFELYLPHSKEEVRILLMRGGQTRIVGRQGVAFGCLYYTNPEIDALRSDLPKKEKVPFKFNPNDLSEIYVWDRFHDGGKWITAKAVDQEYTRGLSLWKHKVIRQYVLRKQKNVDSAALRAAKKHIQQVAKEEYQITQKGKRRRKTLARLQGKGSEPVRSRKTTPSSGNPSPESLEPQMVMIGASSAAGTIPTASITHEQGQVSTSTSRSHKKNGKNTSVGVPVAASSAPAVEQPEWDMTGWGGDYNLP